MHRPSIQKGMQALSNGSIKWQGWCTRSGVQGSEAAAPSPVLLAALALAGRRGRRVARLGTAVNPRRRQHTQAQAGRGAAHHLVREAQALHQLQVEDREARGRP